MRDFIYWLVRAILKRTPLWKKWSLDHSPGLAAMGRCPCDDCSVPHWVPEPLEVYRDRMARIDAEVKAMRDRLSKP